MDINSNIKTAANIIKQGGLVIFPTETVYGIGTNALNETAVHKLYELKKRPLNKPISLLVSNINMIQQVAKDITDIEYQLMEKYFPGPLTIILKKRNIIPNIVTANQDTVGVRIPNNEITQKIIEYANIPIATTSANISGKSSGTNLDMILKDFKESVDFIIDDGESELGIASTVIKVVDGIPQILRQGSLKI